MTMTNHLSQEDLALLGLQLLTEEETRAALQHVKQCNECRHELALLQGNLALYALGVPLQAPPIASRERLLRQVGEEKRVAPLSGSSPGSLAAIGSSRVLPFATRTAEHRTHSRFPTWAGWAVAAGFAVAAVLQFQQRQTLRNELASEQRKVSGLQQSAAAAQGALSPLIDPSALNVSLQQPAGVQTGQHTPQGHAAYLPDRGALVFMATDLQPLQPYKVYELWLLPAEKGGAPVPAASFRPDAAGNANVVLPTGPRLISVKGFGVTIENDKTPPRQPTLPILLLGTSKA